MLVFTLVWTLFAARVFACLGYTDEGTYWTIDNGKNLVIEVSQTNGDFQSMKYNVSINQNFFHIEFWIRMSNEINRQGVAIMATATKTPKSKPDWGPAL